MLFFFAFHGFALQGLGVQQKKNNALRFRPSQANIEAGQRGGCGGCRLTPIYPSTPSKRTQLIETAIREAASKLRAGWTLPSNVSRKEREGKGTGKAFEITPSTPPGLVFRFSLVGSTTKHCRMAGRNVSKEITHTHTERERDINIHEGGGKESSYDKICSSLPLERVRQENPPLPPCVASRVSRGTA
jgi:hypothetical protein